MDRLCCLCLVFSLSCLFGAALWPPARGWPLGSCLWCFVVILSLSHVVSLVRCGT